jgi:hypothetical protein
MNRPRILDLAVVCLSFGMCVQHLSAQTTPSTSSVSWNRYGPGTRSQATAIYDSSTNQMFMFAGQHAPTNVDFNDVWAAQNIIPDSTPTFQNLQWIRVSLSGKQPSDRFGHSAIYNQTTDRMVVFGGGTGFPGPCVNDLWIASYINAVGGKPSWAEQSPTGTPPPIREGHTAVYNPTTNKMIIFGGNNCSGTYYNDVWILSNADGTTGTPSWAPVTPAGTPPVARTQATAIYDTVNNVMTIYGGGEASTTVYGDVWTLTNADGTTGTPTWTELSPKGTAPAARVGQMAIYDSVNNRMTMYGGANNHNKSLNDGWILTYPNNIGGTPTWSEMTFTAPGPYRKSSTVIYSSSADEMVIFGGDSQLADTFTDDHIFILTEANGLSSSPKETK